MDSSTQVASRYLKYNKKRTVLTILGIIIAVSLLSSISTLFLSYREGEIENLIKDTGNYEIYYKSLNYPELDKIINNAEMINSGIVKALGTGHIISTNSTQNSKQTAIALKAYNKSAYNVIFKKYFVIDSGRLPLNEDEIVIESRALYSLKNKKIGDNLIIDIPQKAGNIKKEYKIVGTYEANILTTEGFLGITFLNPKDIDESGSYDAYVNLKENSNKNKIEIANRLGKELKLNVSENQNDSQVIINNNLLRMKGLTINNVFSDKTAIQILILFGIITICSISIIYNNFNIAVMERIKHYGIMRSIGATPSQIRKIVFKEAFYMCLIAIPIGIAAGYISLFLVLELTKKLVDASFEMIQINFYPQVILVCIIVTIIAAIISVWSPARRAGKVSPIEAINSAREIKVEKLIKRKCFLIKLLFGYEGELAYKNSRRKPKVFWTTISALIISIILFNVYTTYTKNVYAYDSLQNVTAETDADLIKFDRYFTIDEINEIKKLKGIDKIYMKESNGCGLIIPKQYVNMPYMNKRYFVGWDKDEQFAFNSNFVYADNSTMSYYDDSGFKIAEKYLIDGKVDRNSLNNNGVLLVQNKVSTYKVGDKLVIPKIKTYKDLHDKYNSGEINDKNADQYDIGKAIKNNQFYTFTVVGILSKDFLEAGYTYDDGIGLVFSEGTYKKINGELDNSGILIKFTDNAARLKLYDYFSKKAAQIGGQYTDYYKQSQDEKNRILREKIFIYTFILLITLISAINIVNSIGINLIARKKEFASMCAIGMTKEQISKMMIYEGLIYGVIACIIGTILGGVITSWLLKAEVKGMMIKIPYLAISIGAVTAILITLIASVIPIRKINKMNIVENLRSE